MESTRLQNVVPFNGPLIYKIATDRNFFIKKVTDIIVFLLTLKWINDQYQLEQDNRLIIYFSLSVLELHLFKVGFKKIILFLKPEHKPKICGSTGKFNLIPLAGTISCIVRFLATIGLLESEPKNLLTGVILKTIMDVVFLVVLMNTIKKECRCDRCLGIPSAVQRTSLIPNRVAQVRPAPNRVEPRFQPEPVREKPRVLQAPLRITLPAIEINFRFNVQVDRPNTTERHVPSQTEEEALAQNQNVLDNIDNAQLKQMLMDTLRCKICDSGVNLYCCKQCSNGFCRDCHENMKQRNMNKRCPFCATEQDSFKYVVLPRMC